MYIIKSFEDLKKLEPKTKFHVIENGHNKPYIFAGISPLHDGKIVMAINDGDHTDIKTFTEKSFDRTGVCFLTGTYSGKHVGEIMINQLDERIASIKSIYTS